MCRPHTVSWLLFLKGWLNGGYGLTLALPVLANYQQSFTERSQSWLLVIQPVASKDSPASSVPAAPSHTSYSILVLPPFPLIVRDCKSYPETIVL